MHCLRTRSRKSMLSPIMKASLLNRAVLFIIKKDYTLFMQKRVEKISDPLIREMMEDVK